MNLEILSFREAMKYEPKEKSSAFRIGGEFDYLGINLSINPLKENRNWVSINNYYFDDLWPKSWKEYSWHDARGKKFKKYLKNKQKKYPKMTKESLRDYLESRGHPYWRYTLFNENTARRILSDFEKVQDKINCVMIHCLRGKNRSPAVGIAMNEIYGWGIEGLKEKFPGYRRFIYKIMVDVSKKK